MEAALHDLRDINRELVRDREDGFRGRGFRRKGGEIRMQVRCGEPNAVDVVFRLCFRDGEGESRPEHIGGVDRWDVER